MNNYKNALEWLESLPQEIQDQCWERLLDQPAKELVEQVLELSKPEDFECLVTEVEADTNLHGKVN